MPEVSVRYIHNDCFGAQIFSNTLTRTSTNYWALGQETGMRAQGGVTKCRFAQA